uniref:Uncharacterized protein n=1 Tax=Rhizophora mucronata TaxID=61149 RepID=A0A2P2QTH3_RHIMU
MKLSSFVLQPTIKYSAQHFSQLSCGKNRIKIFYSNFCHKKMKLILTSSIILVNQQRMIAYS